MAQATYTASVTLKDGSTATHTSEALEYRHLSDGAVAICACCCGMVGLLLPDGTRQEDTRSWHSIYDLGQPVADPAGGPPVLIDPEAEVRAHVQRVAEHHAAVQRAKSFTLDDLMKPKPDTSQPAPATAPGQAPE